jgi:hypothetical protein
MVVRLVPCGARECRQVAIDRERQRNTPQQEKELRTIVSIVEYVQRRDGWFVWVQSRCSVAF